MNLVKVSDSDYDVKKPMRGQYALLLTNGKIYPGLSLANFFTSKSESDTFTRFVLTYHWSFVLYVIIFL